MNDFLNIVRNIKEKLFGKKPINPDEPGNEQKGESGRKTTHPTVEPPSDKSAKDQAGIADKKHEALPSIADSSPEVSGKQIKNEYTETPVSPGVVSLPGKPLFQQNVIRRDPYFIQIGFDFGTSYSKCICRDIMTNKAWVYIPGKFKNQELPFLIPSLIIFQGGRLTVAQEQGVHYPPNGLYHLKNALVKVANKEFTNPILIPYRKAIGESDNVKLSEFVENCVVFFLSATFREIRSHLMEKFPGFGSVPKDYMAINLAIPVADAQNSSVAKLFNKLLNQAWEISQILPDRNSITLNDIEQLKNTVNGNIKSSQDGPCFIYPEVSANVQGFVRSRVSRAGTYLFSDTGASTVDQSIFIFSRHDNSECLTYLAGNVLLLGSGQVEFLAAQASGNVDWKTLESFRKLKEQGAGNSHLSKAKSKIRQALETGTTKSLATAKMKLPVRKQMSGIKVIFGGGGHCENPYATGVMTPFSGNMFAPPLEPDIISMPTPIDLKLNSNETRWMKRLSVAYGLSFERSELARFIYPKDIKDLSPADIWNPKRRCREAPDKDLC